MLKISQGNRSNARHWTNTTTTWPALCGKLQRTVRTRETVVEYHAMTKSERARVKDKGGFVGGHLKDGRRLVQNVECRSILTLDVDRAEPGFIDRFTGECKNAAVLYTTHGHTPEEPRVRIIMPFACEITPDRYAAVARLYASRWGIEQFDECSYRVNQLMYWPTTPSDGEYLCKIIDGPFFDADAFLDAYPNWQDLTALPRSSREKDARTTAAKKQEDPLAKQGIVGAFCRTYTIHDAITKYLSDIYAPTDSENRYDYIPGEGSGGVVVYDDKFAYSHHATDPAGGKLSNAFDLVRWHRFGDCDEKTSFSKMCGLAELDELVADTLEREKQEQAKKAFEVAAKGWEEPIPIGGFVAVPFPVDTLPPVIRDYVLALSESVQAPVDMAGSSSLTVIATGMQRKYAIQAKPDWIEPCNIYIATIAEPSERKSAIEHASIRPISNYENWYNLTNRAAVETSRMRKRILERKQKSVEEQFVKGKATQEDVESVARELVEYEEQKPLRLFVDDITPEKLVSVLEENNGRMALLSSEAGIFDTLAGVYSRSVNIDVMLKSYSGDQIRVDRIGRDSECVVNPALTVHVMAQPNVISRMLSNETFRGRGLVARFLFSAPASAVGERRYRSEQVPPEVYSAYEQRIFNILQDEYPAEPEIITLSPEADVLLEEFSQELEPKLVKEFADISDWCGKLAGNTLRIAGLLCRASVCRNHDFLAVNEPLVIDEQTMKNAIQLGRYFLSHAQCVFSVLPENSMFQNAHRILNMICEKRLKEFNRRTAMRYCQNFKKIEDIQPVLDFLEDYGYILSVTPHQAEGKGRPVLPSYLVNPWVEQNYTPLLS